MSEWIDAVLFTANPNEPKRKKDLTEGPVRTPDDANKSNTLARDLMHLDMLSRGIYMTRRGMVNMSVPMGDKEFDAFANAFDTFLGERSALLQKA